MELTDGVIVMRSPIDSDASGVAAAVQASREHLRPYMPWATVDYDADSAREWMAGDFEAFVVLDETGGLVGTAGVNSVDVVNDRADIGYWLRPDATGNGYATRAANLLLDHATEHMGLHRVEILMSVENEPSRRVAERTPATYEGVQRGRLKYEGRYHDAHVFALVVD